MRQADVAMYRIKETSRDEIGFSSESMEPEASPTAAAGKR